MKADSERKKFYHARNHEKMAALHVHLSKELRKKIKKKKRALLVHKDDKIKVMRGPGKGKTAKVVKVSVVKRKVYVEGVTARNKRGKENMIALQPSNLLLLELEPTEIRKKLFSEETFAQSQADHQSQTANTVQNQVAPPATKETKLPQQHEKKTPGTDASDATGKTVHGEDNKKR
jgi:ribosomal protein uL24